MSGRIGENGAARDMAARSAAAISTAVGRRRQPPLRLTARGRRVLTVLAAVPLAIAALAVALNGGMATATSGSGPVAFQRVTVQAGQSLWQLAESLAPAADPRDVISDIVHLNQLSGADVRAGQQLAIPAQYTR